MAVAMTSSPLSSETEPSSSRRRSSGTSNGGGLSRDTHTAGALTAVPTRPQVLPPFAEFGGPLKRRSITTGSFTPSDRLAVAERVQRVRWAALACLGEDHRDLASCAVRNVKPRASSLHPDYASAPYLRLDQVRDERSVSRWRRRSSTTNSGRAVRADLPTRPEIPPTRRPRSCSVTRATRAHTPATGLCMTRSLTADLRAPLPTRAAALIAGVRDHIDALYAIAWSESVH